MKNGLHHSCCSVCDAAGRIFTSVFRICNCTDDVTKKLFLKLYHLNRNNRADDLSFGGYVLSRLKIEFTTDNQSFSFRKSSNMHGLLMQILSSEYCEKLHSMQPVPCSQYLDLGEKKFWIITGLTDEAYHNVVEPVLNIRDSEFQLDDGSSLKFVSRELKLGSKKEIVERFYDTSSEPDRSVTLEFLTPASFKSASRYVNLPDMRLLYQSWMNRFTAASDMEMFDAGTLQQLTDSTVITAYRLRSEYFPLEQVRIPGFTGRMTFRINGPATMIRYARMLAEFGEYSGVGIKTFLGMGAVRMVQHGGGASGGKTGHQEQGRE